MSDFPGRFFGNVFAVQTLGSAAGRTFTFIDPAKAPDFLRHNLMLTAVHVVLVTTATAGNRVLALQAKDSVGNILAMIPIGTNVAASLTTRITWGADSPNFTSGNFIVANLPASFVLPAGAQLTIFDTANIDVADTIAVNVSAVL
jgi:hypothetical protein